MACCQPFHLYFIFAGNLFILQRVLQPPFQDKFLAYLHQNRRCRKANKQRYKEVLLHGVSDAGEKNGRPQLEQEVSGSFRHEVGGHEVRTCRSLSQHDCSLARKCVHHLKRAEYTLSDALEEKRGL